MTIELPIPLSRADCYLATAAGMAGVTLPEKPLSREELYLAKIAGNESVVAPAPMSLKERWLAVIAGDTSTTAPEVEGAFLIGQQMVRAPFLANCAGIDGVVLPTDPNRTEQYFIGIAQHGPSGVLKTARGINIVLTDVVSGIEELQYVYGDTYQQTYSGKNLIAPTSIHNGSFSSPGQLVNDEYIETGNTKYRTIKIENLPAGTYAFSINWDKTARLLRYATDGSVFPILEDMNTYTFTTTVNGLFGITFRNTNSTDFSDTDYTIQLETGSTATAYEPYVGGIPSPNPDYPQDVQVVTGAQMVTISDGVDSQSYPISLTGKNLWNPTPYKYGYYINNSGAETSSSSASIYGNNMVNPNDTLTLSYTPSVSGNIRIHAYNASGTWLSLIQSSSVTKDTPFSVTFTVPSGATYIRWSCQVSIDDNNLAQLELGSTSTPYIPYSPIELCKIGDYQDYIYKSGDDWYVHKATGKVTYNGSETWIVSNNSRYAIAKPSGWDTWGSDISTYPSKGYSTHLLPGDSGTVDNSFNVGGTNLFIRAPGKGTGVSNTATWKTWLTSNNLTIYSILATPTDTQITDATLVGQLNALDSAVLPKPNATIVVTPTGTNLAGELEISYYGESE